MKVLTKKETELFETYPESIYVVDFETLEVVYMNRAGRRLYKKPRIDEAVRHTWHVMHRDNSQLSALNEFHQVDYSAGDSGENYCIHSALFSKSGREYLLAVFRNIDREHRQGADLRTLQSNEAIVDKAFELAMNEDDPDKAIDLMMESIGENLKADCGYIFEDRGDGTVQNSFEWVREGVPSKIDSMRRIPIDGKIRSLYDELINESSLIIRDIEEIKVINLPLYELLQPLKIRTLGAAPLIVSEKRTGFFGFINIPEDKLRDASRIFEVISHFIAAMLRHRDNETTIRLDPLTGAYSRDAMNRYVKKIDIDKSICLVFCDVNGLKRVNDMMGHEEGDRLITVAARTLSGFFYPNPVFRVGGDEFLVICSGITEEESEKIEPALSCHFEESKVSAAIGVSWSENLKTPFNELYREADNKMYVNKRHMHKLSREPEYSFEAADRIPAACMVRGQTEERRIYYLNQDALELLGCETRDEADALTGGTFAGVIYKGDVEFYRRQTERDAEERRTSEMSGSMENEMSSSKPRRTDAFYRINTKSGRPVSVYTMVSHYAENEDEGFDYVLLFPMQDAEMLGADCIAGLAGLRSFFSFSDKKMRNSPDHTYYFIYTNIVGFKNYNEEKGFEEGDRLLDNFAALLKQTFPKDYFGYLSTDRFAVFTDKNDYKTRISRIYTAFQRLAGSSKACLKTGVYQVKRETAFPPTRRWITPELPAKASGMNRKRISGSTIRSLPKRIIRKNKQRPVSTAAAGEYHY